MPLIAECPWCKGTPRVAVDGGHDERYGYNFTVSIGCCATMTTGSNSDKNGWCDENVEQTKERAITRWNKRA
ncbi:hypothetical protein [Caulobacter phage BL199]|nr:hypothetical protein [Caulobacter phage BL199]